MENYVKDIALSADEVLNLTDKSFVILGSEYREIEFQEDNKETEIKEKLVLTISLNESKAVVEYWPNKTSIKTLTALFGRSLRNWIEKQAKFEVLDQMIAGEKKKVLYVVEKNV